MADYDSPWKEAVDVFFEAFLNCSFPRPMPTSTGAGAGNRSTRNFSESPRRRRSAAATSITWSRSGCVAARNSGCWSTSKCRWTRRWIYLANGYRATTTRLRQSSWAAGCNRSSYAFGMTSFTPSTFNTSVSDPSLKLSVIY